MNEELFRGTRPRVFSTRPENPSEGRTFVWAWTQWFERIEGPSGNVAFTPLELSEEELHEWLNQQGQPEPVEINNEYSRIVHQEFLEQTPLYPEAPELSSEEPFSEQKPTEDVEHG
jgi:hypothetical protein